MIAELVFEFCITLMAFEDRVEIVSVDDGSIINLSSLERAAQVFSHHPTITAHVVWVNPDAATPP